MSENEKNKEELSNKNKFYYVLAFIPFVNLATLFYDLDNDELLKKFTTQGLFLFLIFFVLSIVLPLFWLWWLWKYLFLVYFFLSIYLAWNAYNWHYVDLAFVDKISSIFKWWKKDD